MEGHHHPSAGAVLRILVGALLLAVLGLGWVVVGRHRVRLERLRNQVDALQHEVDVLRRAQAEAERSAPVSPLLLSFQLDLPGRGEVFPAMNSARAPDYWPLAVLRVTNSADKASAQTVSFEIAGWSRRSEQSLVVGPRETRELAIRPELLPLAYANEEIRPASLQIRVSAPDGSVLWTQAHEVLVHSGSEIYWGQRFGNAQVVARWVTPHDPAILQLVSEARRYAPRGRMAGYNAASRDPRVVAAQVRTQMAAIFRALQRSGLSYVDSVFVMGDYVDQAQRIRLPHETLRLASANCIDVSVAFASAVENLGMQPLLVIVPGHAFAGVRLAPNSEEIVYLDLTVLPNGSLDAAVQRARRWLARTPRDEVLVVDVIAARVLGIYPLVTDQPGQTALGGDKRAPSG